VTTPGHSFSLFEIIAEFIVLQLYGLNVPPYFWYKKTNRPGMRNDFYAAKNKMAGVIKRKSSITALQLLSIVLEEFPTPTIRKAVKADTEPPVISDKPLIELDDDSAKPVRNFMVTARKIKDIDGKKEEEKVAKS
jgi:hypothetical protein